MGGGNRLLDSHNFARFTPKFYFILGIIFNLCLLGFLKYTDFLLENFNAFSQIAHLDFNIPLPHILLPLALSFVTFQQIAFLFDCYRNSSLARPSQELEKFSFDRQLTLSQSNFSAQPTNLTQDTRIANDLRESNNSSLRDLQSKSWQSAGFVSEAKQPSKYSPSLAEGARGWVNITTKILTLRNLFIVAFLSGVWHGAGWGFVIWGILHGVAMVIHRIYSWFIDSLNANISSLRADEIGVAIHKNKIIDCHANAQNDSTYTMRFLAFTQSKIYKILAWLITFNFINIAWIFFRAENLSGAVNLLKGMFGIVWVDLPQKWHRMPETLAQINGRNDTIFYIIIAIIVCLAFKNSFEMLKKIDRFNLLKSAFATILIIASFSTMLFENRKIEFLYFNF